MLAGEGGEDPRVMTALDPLSIEADPHKAAAAVAHFVDALHGIVPPATAGMDDDSRNSLRNRTIKNTYNIIQQESASLGPMMIMMIWGGGALSRQTQNDEHA